MNRIDPSARDKLYKLMKLFREGKIDARDFSAQFEEAYNLELDKSTLSAPEAQEFSALFEKIVWYSPFPEERAKIPHYVDERGVATAVEKAAHVLMDKGPNR